MSDEKNKNYKTEWTFSFEKLGDQINEFVQSMGMQGEEAIKHDTFSAPLEEATSASVRLDLSVGETNIHTLSDSANLIEADLTYVGEVKFVVSGETDKNVSLSQVRTPAEWFRGMFGWIGSGRKLKWDVGLSPKVPMKLHIQGGVGDNRFDLQDLQVVNLTMAGGTGEMHAMLPKQATPYPAVVSGGVGEFDLTVPEDTEVELRLSAGTGEINLTYGAGASGSAHINGGIGACNVTLPEGAAVRIEAKTGIGGVSVHGHRLSKVRGGDDFISSQGVWETPGFEDAEKQIMIRFDGGIGGLNVR